MKGEALDACLLKEINFSLGNKITQRENSRRDRSDESEMNPHYFTDGEDHSCCHHGVMW